MYFHREQGGVNIRAFGGDGQVADKQGAAAERPVSGEKRFKTGAGPSRERLAQKFFRVWPNLGYKSLGQR